MSDQPRPRSGWRERVMVEQGRREVEDEREDLRIREIEEEGDLEETG